MANRSSEDVLIEPLKLIKIELESVNDVLQSALNNLSAPRSDSSEAEEDVHDCKTDYETIKGDVHQIKKSVDSISSKLDSLFSPFKDDNDLVIKLFNLKNKAAAWLERKHPDRTFALNYELKPTKPWEVEESIDVFSDARSPQEDIIMCECTLKVTDFESVKDCLRKRNAVGLRKRHDLDKIKVYLYTKGVSDEISREVFKVVNDHNIVLEIS